MAILRKIGVTVETRVLLELSEEELLALDALLGYDFNVFLQTFYKEMGRAYLEPHEAGLRSLYKTVGRCSGLADEARECREFMRRTADERLRKQREQNQG